MKKLLFGLILGLSAFTTACGGWSKPSSSSNNNKPDKSGAESNKNKGDKDVPVAELLVTNGFLYNEKREITAYDFIDESTVQDESDVVAGFVNIKEENEWDYRNNLCKYYRLICNKCRPSFSWCK